MLGTSSGLSAAQIRPFGGDLDDGDGYRSPSRNRRPIGGHCITCVTL
jgi:hypothetical protein